MYVCMYIMYVCMYIIYVCMYVYYVSILCMYIHQITAKWNRMRVTIITKKLFIE